MLETIWFVLWGVLWGIYFMLDGFDLGIGALMPFLAGNDEEKRIMYKSIGPFWDGNEVWLITAGGVTFAAFPLTYAVMFSSLYSALMLVLFSLIFRAVSIEFRNKQDSPKWRAGWDLGMFLGSALPAILLGIAFANIFKGIPIDGQGIYKGTLFTLLNPYGLIGGVLFLFLFLLHGALWLAIKTEGDLHRRSLATANKLWPVLLVVAVVFLAATGIWTQRWSNYLKNPLLFVIPLFVVAALILTKVFLSKQACWKAWFASCGTILGATLFGVIGLYPNLLPSSLDPAFSLTAFNSSSSPLTLKIMLVVVLVFMPVVIAYQTWVYILFKDKVTIDELAYEEAY
ncbi:cytochrome d ubiquinol oxidase subunit II [Thermodesulfobacteriota bacterium]